MADYHFNAELCPPVPSTPIDVFLSTLLQQEIKILATQLPEDEQTFNRWDEQMQKYIKYHANLLVHRQHLLGEPVMGHGDTKINNIIVTEEGVGIMDPAPVVLWRINERRMDAFFMAADLELSGHKDAADSFWNAYLDAYNQHISAHRLSPEEENIVVLSNPVVDLITSIYRFGIFYRLARIASKNLTLSKTQRVKFMTRADLAGGYVERGYEKLTLQLS